MKPVPALLLLAALGTGACQPTLESYAPLLDRFTMPEGRDLGADLLQCRDLATEPDLSAVEWSETALGTALGGTFGLLAGILFGSPNWGLGIGAAYGAVVGYASGTAQHLGLQQGIIARCLMGRGYSVLVP